MAAMGTGLSSLTKLRYLLVAVALVLLAVLQVQAQDEGPGKTSVIIELPVANSTNSEANMNTTLNDRRLSIEVHVTGSTILDRADLDTCLEYAEEKINAYPARSLVQQSRRPGSDIFIPYATATTEIAGWMKGGDYPPNIMWGDLFEIVQGIKEYLNSTETLEPIAVAGMFRGEIFVYFFLAATRAKGVASS